MPFAANYAQIDLDPLPHNWCCYPANFLTGFVVKAVVNFCSYTAIQQGLATFRFAANDRRTHHIPFLMETNEPFKGFCLLQLLFLMPDLPATGNLA